MQIYRNYSEIIQGADFVGRFPNAKTFEFFAVKNLPTKNYSEIIISDKPLFCNNISLPSYDELISNKDNSPPSYENFISENIPEPSAPPIED